MTTGLSGAYAFNGVDLQIEPTEGRWIERPALGIDGNGHPIYPRTRSFELSWQLISPADFNQIRTSYDSISNTGTIAVDLPQWNAADYRFNRYSGVVLSEPTIGAYFNEYVTDIRLLITNITV